MEVRINNTPVSVANLNVSINNNTRRIYSLGRPDETLFVPGRQEITGEIILAGVHREFLTDAFDVEIIEGETITKLNNCLLTSETIERRPLVDGERTTIQFMAQSYEVKVREKEKEVLLEL